jgi:dUTPase|tara:strand:+ start:8345 stop:8626 length:282 start_codon:yes stop_codon:yes gene_type:complete
MNKTRSLKRTVDEWRKNWLYALCMYLENNYEKIKETKVLSHERVRVNDEEYKVDINDYTGSDVNYIFFNVSNGRLVIQKGKRLTIEKFDVEVV